MSVEVYLRSAVTRNNIHRVLYYSLMRLCFIICVVFYYILLYVDSQIVMNDWMWDPKMLEEVNELYVKTALAHFTNNLHQLFSRRRGININQIGPLITESLVGMGHLPDLHQAVYVRDARTAQSLLQDKADVNGIVNGITPVGLSVLQNDSQMVQLLISHQANVNVEYVHTHLLLFAEVSTAEILLNAKADPNYTNASGTLLYQAVHDRNLPLVETLLWHRVNITHDALKAAVKSSHEDIARLLLQQTLDINDPALGILHIAVQHRSLSMVSMLLAYKADPNVRNHDGKIPLDLAKGCNRSLLALIQPRVTCSACPNTDGLKPCQCKKVFYCSQACQKMDWVTHKPKCVSMAVPSHSNMPQPNQLNIEKRRQSSLLVQAIQRYTNGEIDAHTMRTHLQQYALYGDDVKYQPKLREIEDYLLRPKVKPFSKPVVKDKPVSNLQPKTKPKLPKPKVKPKPKVLPLPPPPPPQVEVLQPPPAMCVEDRLTWHGQVNTPLTLSPPQPPPPPPRDTPTYVAVLLNTPSFGTLFLDYAHVFEGPSAWVKPTHNGYNEVGPNEVEDETIHGFHHDENQRVLRSFSSLKLIRSDFDTMNNGCYQCEFHEQTISFFPSTFSPNHLLARLKRALVSPLFTVYKNKGDTCIIGKLAQLPGDTLAIIYFKAIIKRHIPGVIRTVYPLTFRQYSRECEHILGIMPWV